MKKHVVNEQNEGVRVDKFVTKWLQDDLGFETIPRSFVSKHFKDIVRVNQKIGKPSCKLRCGDEVSLDEEFLSREYEHAKDALEMEGKIIAQKGVLEIVFENSDYLVLNKKSNLVVHPGVGNAKNTLANYVKGYLQEKGCYDNELKRAGIIHRLDKGVGGLIVFAKNRKAQIHIAKQFENHEVLKIYLAEIQGKFLSLDFAKKSSIDILISQFSCGEDLNLTAWQKVEGVIGRDRVNRKRMVFYPNSFDKKYRYALSYVLPVSEEKLFVLIKTGRMHQIRATLKSMGLALRGDKLYGYKGEEKGEIGLNSVVLGFKDLDGKMKIYNLMNRFL